MAKMTPSTVLPSRYIVNSGDKAIVRISDTGTLISCWTIERKSAFFQLNSQTSLIMWNNKRMEIP